MKAAVLITAALGALVFQGAAMAADVTARETLPRGTILAASDITIYPAPEEDPALIAETYIGKQLTRTVYAGREITPAHLQAPMLVRRNGMVIMTYRFGTMTITTAGRALDEGGMGDLVEVMNMQSKKKVQAIVTGPDQVSVQ